jgi:CheY-like chemotaxis protein
VSGVEKMLRRVLGEDIALVTSLAPDVSSTRADSGQLEQVIMNLAINARDAMPVGGRLEISTSNAELDEEYTARHIDARAGEYVKLSVADTGEGMDRSTLEQIFEPFFTTKPQGKGTGLGLATVYGIVSQTGGHIVADSELGRGTVFEVYLPRAHAEVDRLEAKPALAGPSHGETVLLVEDEDIVRALLQRILENAGYQVLTAASGDDALVVAAGHATPIDVLVTDVVMPGMSGREVAEQLREARPSLSVIFVSGYTEEAIANHGVLGDRAVFLQKPFDAAAITAALRDVLDTQRAA